MRCFLFVIFLFFTASVFAQSTDDVLSKAQMFHSDGQIDSAIFLYKKVINNLLKEGRTVEGLHLAVDIADLFYAQQQFEEGQHILDPISEKFNSYQNEEERAALLEAFLFRAYGYEQSGQFENARNAYEAARLMLVNKPEHEDFYVARYLYQPLGNIYTRFGEVEEALKLLERFKEISIAEEEFDAAAQAYNDIGIIYKSLNHYEKVIEDFQNALEFPDLSPTTRGLLLSNLASAYYETLQNENALAAAQRSITEFQKEKTAESTAYLSQVYSTLGKIYTSLENPEEALWYFERSVTAAIRVYGTDNRREVAKIYVNMGYLFLLQNQPEAALKQYQKALTRVVPGFQPTTIYQSPPVAMLYAENTIFEALEGKTRAMEMLYSRDDDPELLKEMLKCFDLIAEVEWQLRQTYKHESSKLLLMEESHHRSERALFIAYRLYRFTQNAEYLEKAFQISERSKATVLLESLKALRIGDLARVPDSLLHKEQELKSEITALKNDLLFEQMKGSRMDTLRAGNLSGSLFAAELELARLYRKLEARYPEYYSLKKPFFERADINSLRTKLLSENSQLVSYFVGESSLFIFSLTRVDFHLTHIPNTDSLNEAVTRLIQLVTKRVPEASDVAAFEETAFGLYQNLLAPVLEASTKKLIIIPDGPLGYLPFDLLTDRAVQQPSFSRLPYLVKSMAISYGFSASILLENKNAPLGHGRADKNFLGLAPMFKNSPEFSFLPFSEEEVKLIKKELGGRVLLGQEATKKSFTSIADQYRIIHLSSHAAVVDSLPLYSWIGFSASPHSDKADNKLFLSELYSMRLHADLAVLSACETGSGKLSRGEGIMSLARGFAFAGCNSIVTTLWPVNDASTSLIMTRFYHHLSKGLPKDEALRKAKLDYLNGENIDQFGANPFFWAAYIPVGNMAPIDIEKRFSAWWLLPVAVAVLFLLMVYNRRRSKMVQDNQIHRKF